MLYHYSGCGPSFGTDLYISDGANNNSSSASICNTYSNSNYKSGQR